MTQADRAVNQPSRRDVVWSPDDLDAEYHPFMPWFLHALRRDFGWNLQIGETTYVRMDEVSIRLAA